MVAISSPSDESGAYDPATLNFYALAAPVYTSSGPNDSSRYLDAFLRALPPGCRILELGCGGGRDSQEILARGFQLDATDGVPEIARKAEKRTGHPVRVMRFDELDAVDEYFGVWAHASLLHVPRPNLSNVLSLILRALKPGGIHFANYKAGGEEGRDARGRYFNYMNADELRRTYDSSGVWNVAEIFHYLGSGYEGCQIPWAAITARKPV
jgi:SAM-dependent methyltransferase